MSVGKPLPANSEPYHIHVCCEMKCYRIGTHGQHNCEVIDVQRK